MTTQSVFGVFPEMFLDFLENSKQLTPELAESVHRPAFEQFIKLGFPSRKNEEWKYTNTKALAQLPFRQSEGSDEPDAGLIASLLRDNEINVVFIDGHLSSAYSSLVGLQTGISVKDLKTAYAQNPVEMKAMLAEKVGDALNPFRFLNAAFLKSGVFIEVEKNVTVVETVHIIHISTGAEEAPSVFFPRIMVKAGKSSSLKLIESYAGKGKYLVSAQTNFFLNENAQINHVRIQNDAVGAYHIGQGQVSLAANASLKSLSVCIGSLLHRVDFDCRLGGAGGHLELNGFYHTDESRHVDNHTLIDHAAPNATSSQLYKGIIDGHSRAVFNGKVLVQQVAQQTAAFQMNKNLLLSSDAEIDTKPELQIDADDVKCSHGATVGQLNADELFYMQSRGIRYDEAVTLLSRAFADDVLATNPIQGSVERVHQLVHGSLKW